MERVIPVVGLAVLVGLCWLLSDRRRAIDWRIPAWGLALQLLFGVIGAVIFIAMHHWLSAVTPQYWQFWIGLMLVVIVLAGRERLVRAILSPFTWLLGLARGRSGPAK